MSPPKSVLNYIILLKCCIVNDNLPFSLYLWYTFAMFSTQVLIIISLCVLLLVSLLFSIYTQLRIKKLLLGSNGDSIERILASDRQKVQDLQREVFEVQKSISVLNHKFTNTLRGVPVLRYNPFESQGSNQSFSASLLDETGNGVVITSLFSRERVNIFAKPILAYASSYDLSDEEKKVIAQSKEIHEKK